MCPGGAAVQPVEDLPPLQLPNPRRVGMKNIQGMPGTAGSLIFRIFQFVTAAACWTIVTTHKFHPPAFFFLVTSSAIQSLWSLALLFIDIYALLVGRSLLSFAGIIGVFDWMTLTSTLASAWAAMVVVRFIEDQTGSCNNDCFQTKIAAWLAFCCWILMVIPSYNTLIWTFL